MEAGSPLLWTLLIVDLTTNADVQRIECPQDQTIFVTTDHLYRCYPEVSDKSWTGRKGNANVFQRIRVLLLRPLILLDHFKDRFWFIDLCIRLAIVLLEDYVDLEGEEL